MSTRWTVGVGEKILFQISKFLDEEGFADGNEFVGAGAVETTNLT